MMTLPGVWTMVPRIRLGIFLIVGIVCLLIIVVMKRPGGERMATPDFQTDIPDFQKDIPAWFGDANFFSKEALAGKWVRSDVKGRENGWRVFSATGSLSVCYGDAIYEGSYQLLDNRTIEIRYRIYGKPDELERWSGGIFEGKLIMVNRKKHWLEEYKLDKP